MTPLPPTEPLGNAERDAHLQGALRHAPDANVVPPAALSDAILRAAHAAVAQAQRASPAAPGWQPLAALWAWLGQPRLAGALAGLMVATLVGALWWGQPIERAFEPAPQAPLRSNDSAPAPTAATAPARPAPAEPVAAKSKLARPLQKSEAEAPAPVLVESAPAPARREAAAETPAAAAAEARPTGAVLAQAAPALDAATAESRAATAAATPAPVAPARQADAAARQRAALSDTGAQALAPKSAGAALASLADLRAAIAARPGRWSWQFGTHAPRAMTDELQAWLARLDAAASVASAGAASAGAALSSSGVAEQTGATLQLLRDSQPHSSVRWSVDAVQIVVVGTAQVSQRAGLAPQIARELDAELAQIAAR